jgi:hypothetical protein
MVTAKFGVCLVCVEFPDKYTPRKINDRKRNLSSLHLISAFEVQLGKLFLSPVAMGLIVKFC